MKKFIVYVVFIDLEKVYDRVDRESLWHVLRMCDGGGGGGQKKKTNPKKSHHNPKNFLNKD